MKSKKILISIIAIVLLTTLLFSACDRMNNERFVAESIVNAFPEYEESDLYFYSGVCEEVEGEYPYCIYCKIKVHGVTYNYKIRVNDFGEVKRNVVHENKEVLLSNTRTELNANKINRIFNRETNRQIALKIISIAVIAVVSILVLSLITIISVRIYRNPKNVEKRAQREIRIQEKRKLRKNRNYQKKIEKQEQKRIEKEREEESKANYEKTMKGIRDNELARERIINRIERERKKAYRKKTSLAVANEVLGWIAIIGTIILGVSGALNSVLYGIIAIVVSPIAGLPFFAIAKIIDLLDEIAYNTMPKDFLNEKPTAPIDAKEAKKESTDTQSQVIDADEFLTNFSKE